MAQELLLLWLLAIPKLQSQWESPIMKTIQNIISKIFSSKIMLIVLLIVYFTAKRKITVIVFLIFFYTKNYIIYVSKMAFMDPRPFWSTTHVKQLEWGCPDQFGNPSGPSSSAFFYAVLINDVILRNQGPLPLIIAAILGLSVPISRLYLGAQSSNQVVLGMILELSFLVLYRYKLHEIIYNGLNNLIRRKNIGQLILIIFVYVLVLFIPLAVYQLRMPNPTGQTFRDNMLIGCPKSKTRTGLQMLTKTFEGCGLISLIFGFALAIWISNIDIYKYLYDRWRYSFQASGFILRVVIEFVSIFAAFWLLTIVFPKMLVNAYLIFLSVSLGSFLVGFMAIFLPRRLLTNCQIIQEIQPIASYIPFIDINI